MTDAPVNLLPPDLVEAAHRSPSAVTRVVDQRGGTPLRDGDTVTLLHHGTADEVYFQHWMDVFPELPPFTRVPETNLWWLTFELAPEARIEYKIRTERLGRRRTVLDRFNPALAPNPWGGNSVLAGSAYERPKWSLANPAARRGRIEVHMIESAIFGGQRIAHLYTPPGGTAMPLLVVHDGSDYLQFAAFASVLDNLIADGDIPPVAAVLTDPFDRFGEYRASNKHAVHLMQEVLPVIEDLVIVTSRVAMGASLGAVASLHMAWTHQGRFDGLVLQGGSFVTQLGGPHHRSQIFQPVVNFMERFLAKPGELPGVIHLSCGIYDGLAQDNRRFAGQLQMLGPTVGHEEIASGHDWHAWRDLLRSALMFTFDRL